MSKLRGAVIGAGRMGRNHIRIMSQHPDVEIVGVVDPDTVHAKEVAAPWGAPVFATIEELPEIDVAIVVTPTQYHADAALKLMERGVHLLIEKPLAQNPEVAKQLVETAHAKGLTLAVGHVERFNPAVSTLKKLLHEPKMILIERLSPYTPRIKDSVIYDLAIHDIDLACWLAGGNPVKVEAIGMSVFSETTDVATSIIRFDSGCIATLQTSRATQDKVRRISVSEPNRYIVADTLRQDIEIKRQAEVSYEGEGEDLVFAQASIVEIPTIDRGGEPLAREQDDFYKAVINKTRPTVSGEDGLQAVTLVEQIEQLCK
ncbi:MAG: Gfo/Idh/MocA family oxidoreductase [Coriobacteriia bacterium]|nr:Gfo/Idh/MocA family oxidoreductase [Coriobacteriia bacterium]